MPLRFEPSHGKVSRSQSGSRAALLGSHCSDSSVPDPEGAGTGCQRLGCTPSGLPVIVTRRKKYICDVLEIVLLEPNVMTFLVATAHRRKTTDNCAVFIRSISLLNAQSNMFLFTRLPSFLTRLLVDLPACLMRLR